MITSEGAFFRTKYFRFSLGVIIGAALLFLSLKDVSWPEVKGELEGISYAWILFAIFLYWIELALRIGPMEVSLISIEAACNRRSSCHCVYIWLCREQCPPGQAG